MKMKTVMETSDHYNHMVGRRFGGGGDGGGGRMELDQYAGGIWPHG